MGLCHLLGQKQNRVPLQLLSDYISPSVEMLGGGFVAKIGDSWFMYISLGCSLKKG